jgi:hypothetical protein
MPLIQRCPPFELNAPSVWVRWHAGYLDNLFKSTTLAFASMVPTVPGVVAACGALAYDFSHRLWFGGVLSGLSLIPVIGYLPGAGKIAWNLRLLDAELRTIEELLPRIQGSPELTGPLKTVIQAYLERISKVNRSLPIIQRLRVILDDAPASEDPEVFRDESSRGPVR